MQVGAIHPKLDPAVDQAPLPRGAALLRHTRHGTQLAVAAADRPVLDALDGAHSLEALEALAMRGQGGPEGGGGALGYQSLVVLLFHLWDRGMLANEDEVRAALFPHHRSRTLDRAKARRWVELITDVRLFGAGAARALRPAGAFGGLLLNPGVLAARGLLAAAGLALIVAGVAPWKGHLLRLDGSFEAGIPLFYLTSALAMSWRGLVRAAMLAAPVVGPGLQRAGVRLVGGIAHLDVDDTAVYHLAPDVQRRFALSGLSAPGEIGAVCAIAAAAGAGGSAASLAAVTCYLALFVNLCPFLRTDGARLAELLSAVPKQRFRVQSYLRRRLVRDVFGGRKGGGAMSAVAVLWVVWFFAAFRLLDQVLLEDLAALLAALLTSDGLALLVFGAPLLAALMILAVVMLGTLAWVLLQAAFHAILPEGAGIAATSTEKPDVDDLTGRLARLPVAAALPEAARRALAERASVVTFRGGEWVRRVADGPCGLSWVLQGRVELLRPLPEGGHELLAVVTEGGHYGVEAITGGEADLDVRAEGAGRLAVIDAEALRHVLAEGAEGAAHLAEAVDLAKFLDGVGELAGLGPSARLDVALSARVRTVGTGEVIVRQGDPAEALYLVRSGACRAMRRGQDGSESELGRIGPGEAFGEIGLLLRRPRTATVTTAEPTTLVELPAEVIDAALRRSFHVGLALEKLAETRLATVEVSV